MPGMVKSNKTRSGRNSLAILMASAPFSASPQTLRDVGLDKHTQQLANAHIVVTMRIPWTSEGPPKLKSRMVFKQR